MLTEIYQNCPSYRDFCPPITINVSVVRLIEVSVEQTVLLYGILLKTVGTKPSVRLTEVSVNRELTVCLSNLVQKAKNISFSIFGLLKPTKVRFKNLRTKF